MPWAPCPSQSVVRGASRRAAMLLEVLISIAIMVLAIATIGAQVSNSLNAADYTDKLNRGLMLAEWVMAEMDLPAEEEDRLVDIHGEEGEGTFGERYPGFAWRIRREPTDVDNLDLISLEILTGDPEEPDLDSWDVLHTVYALRPIVAEFDPTDFGMPSEEDIGLLAAATPPTGEDGTVPGALPPELEELLAALPMPMQEIFQRILGGEPVPMDEIRTAISELTAEDLLGLLTTPALFGVLTGGMGGMMGGGGGGIPGLEQLLGGGAGGADTQALQKALQQGNLPNQQALPSALGGEDLDTGQAETPGRRRRFRR